MVAFYYITGIGWLAIAGFDAAICGFLGAMIAEHKGISSGLGGLLGFVLGPIGLLIVAVIQEPRPAKRSQR